MWYCHFGISPVKYSDSDVLDLLANHKAIATGLETILSLRFNIDKYFPGICRICEAYGWIVVGAEYFCVLESCVGLGGQS